MPFPLRGVQQRLAPGAPGAAQRRALLLVLPPPDGLPRHLERAPFPTDSDLGRARWPQNGASRLKIPFHTFGVAHTYIDAANYQKGASWLQILCRNGRSVRRWCARVATPKTAAPVAQSLLAYPRLPGISRHFPAFLPPSHCSPAHGGPPWSDNSRYFSAFSPFSQHQKPPHPSQSLLPCSLLPTIARNFPEFPGISRWGGAPEQVSARRPPFSVGLTTSAVRCSSRRPPGSFRCS